MKSYHLSYKRVPVRVTRILSAVGNNVNFNNATKTVFKQNATSLTTGTQNQSLHIQQ